ncbi:MAG: DUF2905 domain-containing protein [Patescibacteria group bacterium]
MFHQFAKILILVGFLLILIGVIFLFGSKVPCFGKLPGDIYIKKGNFTFFAPIGTCILISIILSIIFYIISRFFK